jgi:cation/acetate symporter
MAGGALLAFLVLLHFELKPLRLFAAAAEKYGTKVLQPGSRVVSGQWDAISLGLGLMFGTAAMPHILMRVYTVRDVKEARMSILHATGIIGIFHLFVFIIGFGAMVMVGPEAVAKAGGGGNMRRRFWHWRSGEMHSLASSAR